MPIELKANQANTALIGITDPYSTSCRNLFDTRYAAYAKSMRIGIKFIINEITQGNENFKLRFGIQYQTKRNGSWLKHITRQATEYKKGYAIPIFLEETKGTGTNGILSRIAQDDFEDIYWIYLQNESEEDVKLNIGWNTPFLILYNTATPAAMTDAVPLGYNILGTNPDALVVTEKPIDDIVNSDIEYESFSMTESLCSQENIKFGLCESAFCSFTVVDRKDDWRGRTIKPFIKAAGTEKEIPLGVFKVESIRKTHSHDMVKKTITAYDAIAGLNVNAFNWYTFYMYTFTSKRYESRFGVEYPRQIYSTFYNIASKLNLDKRDKNTETAQQRYGGRISTEEIINDISGKNIIDVTYESDCFDVDPQYIYAFDLTLRSDITIEYLAENMKSYQDEVDPYFRGILTGNIMIYERNSDGLQINSFLVDSGDCFQLSPQCTSVEIFYPRGYTQFNTPGYPYRSETIKESIDLYKTKRKAELVNGWIGLVYYNYFLGGHEVYEADSTITARDVIRSLLEVCGCFFKIDRYGIPRFIYCQKSGLYPSDNLYPSDDLYPHGGNLLIENMSQYEEFDCESYEVLPYGKVQILKVLRTNEAKSVVQWEYKGSDAKNTYKIEDNIFYCNEKMEYDYDLMPEVAEMLENMWRVISNMGYVPHTTKAHGLPFVETGDRIALLTKTGGEESFIFRRTLSGINNLRDTYEATGEEYVEEISEYSYKEWRQ